MDTSVRWVIGLLACACLLLGAAWLLHRGVYGLTLFLVSPAMLGAIISALVPSKSGSAAFAVGAFAAILGAFGLLLTGVEGAICSVMSLPLTIPAGGFGSWLVFRFQTERTNPRGVAMLLLVPGVTLGFDTTAQPPVYEVRSSIEIAASPEQVWPHVVAFAKMPEPSEWYFHTGLAYPTAARIEGSGLGARRYCDLSTGPVVESVEVWDEPRLLRFGVIDTPPPMREWSPYGEVSARHLHGYMISREGQFRLIALGPHRTRVEGTSWYQHGLWPAQYWRLWSDAIVHRIHIRVLEHIRALAEADSSRAAYNGRTK
jgi:Polyketide cyclase / dehydrase and lipid transport